MTLVAGSAAVAHQQIAMTRPDARASAAAPTRAAVSPPHASPTESTRSTSTVRDAAPPPVTADFLVSPADGRISSVFVAVGDHVEAGQSLAAIVSPDAARTLARLATDVEAARQAARDIERSVAALDEEIAAAVAVRTKAAADSARQMAAAGDDPTQAALSRAETVYTDAIARERRAAVLGAHGVRAIQELEAAQVAVRTAAAEVVRLRRALQTAAAASAADSLRAVGEADARIAAQQRQREERAAALQEALLRQREADTALALARERLATVVRSRLAGTIVNLAMQPGSRVATGSALAAIQP